MGFEGVLALAFDAEGRDQGGLERALVRAWPRRPCLRAPDSEIDELLQVIFAPLRERRDSSPVRVGLCGTPFQMRVWQEVRAVPAGQVVSYRVLAGRLGIPQGSRAVARALAANRVGYLIPCHRVIGSDGTMRGYRWGVALKKELLRLEGWA